MPSRTHPSIHLKILGEMLALPTAPFAEHVVLDYVERFCKRRRKVRITSDSAGNLLARVRQGRRRVRRPVCITAHLDHPGFVADKMVSKRRVRAFWRGGVPREYFVGSGVRFHVDGSWVRGSVRTIKTVMQNGVRRVRTATVDVPANVPSGSIGMWDFPEPKVRSHRIHARGCDDIAGASAMLCCIDRLVRGGDSCDAYFLFTRAEEVGFVGAIAAARLGTIPSECFVVAMETSAELPSAKMGDGPILRVGDRSSTFTPHTTAYCHLIARSLARSDRSFRFQRKLMDGGTCESSAYCTLGHDATGLCIALGNYHNINAKAKRLAPEYVDLYDFDHVVKWFVELAKAPYPYTGRDESLNKQLDQLEREHRALLRSSRMRPK